MEQSQLLNWAGQTAVIIGSGPSLTPEQQDLVWSSEAKNIKAITTNSTAFVCPWADVHYACDFLFFKTYSSHVTAAKHKWWTQDRTSGERYGVNWVRQSARPGLGKKEIQTNGNSVFGSIGLAYLFGCRRILLIGCDMKLGPQGKKHHHPDHPPPMVQKLQFDEWLHKSILLARDLKEAGCEVINCTPGSALTVWPMSDLAKELDK